MKTPITISPTLIRTGIAKALGALALSCAVSPMTYADWSVAGSQILDPKGQPFVYRGVNLGILPPANSLPQVYADIAASGANAIRISIDNLTPARAQIHVDLCKQHEMVCVFAHTLSAGYVDNNHAPASLYLIDAWSTYVDLLKANKDYVVIDLASAMAGNVAQLDYYISTQQTALYFIRSIWDLKNQVIISGGNWGQDWSFLMRDNAEAVLAMDPLENTVLSLHMYEAYGDAQTVRDTLDYFKTRDLPIMIAEFGPIKRDRLREFRNPYNTTHVAVESIMDVSEELGIGYLGWNWSGYTAHNQSSVPDYSALNIVTDFNAQQVTPWGDLLINSEHGIKATAKVATHFPSGSSSSVGNRPPKAYIDYTFYLRDCGIQLGKVKAVTSDPDDDVLSFAWEIYRSDTGTTTHLTGPSLNVDWPAQVEMTIKLTVDDGQGNVVTEFKDFGRNTNLDTCPSSTPGSSSNSSSSKPASNASTSSVRVSSATATSYSSCVVISGPPRVYSSSSIPGVSVTYCSGSSTSSRSSSSRAAQGNCRYVINSQWDNGFTATIRMTNTGAQPISGWNVNWQYSDGSTVTGSWNTALSGNNPYSAKNVHWNATIRPGQTVEFGFQGKKPVGAAQIPVVTGSVCQ